jgi:sulfofructose kinase
MTPTQILCVGHAALDRVFAVDAWPTGSAKIVASRFDESGGGMGANAAVAAARLGARVAFWGPTGDDATADVIAAQLRDEGVDVHNLRRLPGVRSSSSAVLIDARGERLVVGFRSEALHSPADWLPLHAVSGVDAVLADVRWPEGAAAVLQAARERNVHAILDGEVAERDVLERLLSCAQHVVFSERGLSVLSADVEGGLRLALARGAELAAVTRGERGVLWIEKGRPERTHHCPAYTVNAIDTLAAGDVFHGAYALAIAQRRDIEHAMRFASAAAAIKCTRPGGRGGAPTLAEVETFLQHAR